ncbi:MAG: recombinase family protein [Planctomycetota bacterium]|nr:recombinase family protein [Planctomycetota bacterium]
MITQTRAAAYTRMSTNRQEKSPAQQRAEIEQLAEREGYKIVRWYSDDGVSGDATEKRIEFQRMIADATTGEFDVILCWDQDRFGRFDSLEAGHWIHPLRAAGVRLVTVTQGTIDWSDFSGRIVYSVIQEGKNAYLRDLSRNVVRGMKDRAADGKWAGGKPPIGYVIGDEGRLHLGAAKDVAIVRRIFREFTCEGRSLRAIAQGLSLDGVISPKGKKWTFNGIRGVLTNPAYLGHVCWGQRSESKYRKDRDKTKAQDRGKWTVVENAHPAIIAAETFSMVEELLATRRQTHSISGEGHSSTRGKYLLGGLLYCGHCGAKMAGSGENGSPAYVCYTYRQRGSEFCHGNRVQQSVALENIVTALQDEFCSDTRDRLRQAMRRQLEGLAAADTANRDQLADIEIKIAKADRRLVEVSTDMIPRIEKRIRELEAERDHVAGALASVPVDREAFVRSRIKAAIGWIDRLGEAFEAADTGLVRQVLRESIARVEITMDRTEQKTKPGKRPRHVYSVAGGSIYLVENPANKDPNRCTEQGTAADTKNYLRIKWIGDLSKAA